MAQTEKGIVYPYDYNEVADVPSDFKALAESIDALLNDYSLNTDSGNKIVLEMNNTTYKIKAVLKDKDDNVIDTSNEIDLPLENMVTNISYNDQTLTLTHQDGQTTEVSIADLISDLASKEEVTELQSQVDDLTTLVETELDTNEVEGTEIDVSDSAEYPGKIMPGANLEQEQLSGNQLVDFSNYTKISTNGEYTFVNNILIFGNKSGTFSHVEFDITELAKSNSDKVLKFTFEDINLNNQYGTSVQLIIKYNDGTNILYKTLVNHDKTVFSYTIPSYTNNIESITLCIYSNNSNTSQASSVIITKPMLQFGTEDKDYEQYCGGQASPNPDYPQPIKVVTGDNVVKHFVMNLFDFIANLNTEIAGLTISSDKAGNIIVNGTPTRNWVTIAQKVNITDLLEDGQTYTLWQENIESNGGRPWFYVQVGYGENTASNYYSITTASNMLKFTVDKSKNNIYQIMVQTGNNLVNYNNVKNRFMLLKGDYTNKEVVYEPYIEEEYKLDLWKENEFDSENANVLNAFFSEDGKMITSSNKSKTLYIPCKANCTYKITKKLSTRFRLLTTNVLPDISVIGDNYIFGDLVNCLKITTGSNAKYLCVFFYNSDYDTLTVQEILDSIQIQEAIELCKIGDYEDILFKNEVVDENYNAELEEGAWYKKSLINKVVFTGNENFTLGDNSQYSDTILRFDTRIADKKLASNFTSKDNLFCDSFCVSYLNYEARTREAIAGHSNYYQLAIFINKNRLPSSDVAGLKAWLSSHNVECFYVKNTPTYEKITDPTLISQLEALKKAKWFKGVNHWWTETENLEPNLKGTYKQSNNLRIKEQDERLDNLESRLALLE